MEQVKLEAQIRTLKGKSDMKKLRLQGLCPGVVCKAGSETLSLAVSCKELFGILKTSAGENAIINLAIKKDDKPHLEKTVIIKEIQREPIKGLIVHVDFCEISLTKEIRVAVSIVAKGESPGVKDGGILQYVLREVEVECLPTQIPEKIEVDVSGMNIGDTVFVRNLVLPEGVKVLNDPELILINIEPPMKEEVVAPAAAEAAPAEPEVLREKKPTPEELAAAAEEEKKEKEKK